jgi:hypothetical protein
MTEEELRKAFEEWAEPNWFIRRDSWDRNRYNDSGTECAWRGWKACYERLLRAAPQPEVSQE